MKKTEKQLKQNLKGTKQLRLALDTLRWKAWPPPSDDSAPGYVVGTSAFVEYVAQLILQDLASQEEFYKKEGLDDIQ